MDNITLDKIEYKIKNNWNEISINNYFYIVELIISEVLSEEEKYANILSICMDKDIEYIDSMNIQHFLNLAKNIKFIQTELQTINIPGHIYIDNKLFKIEVNPAKLTASQFINLNNFYKEGTDKDKMINVVSTLIQPAKKIKTFYKDDIVVVDYNWDEHIKFIGDNLNIVLANSIYVFFYHLLKFLFQNSITSLENQVVRKKLRLKWKKKLGILKKKELDGLIILEELQQQLIEVGKKFTI